MKAREKPTPAEVGRQVARYHAARRALMREQARSKARLEPLETELSRCEAAVLAALAKHRLSAARGAGGGVTRVVTLVPSVEDWGKFIAYVVRERAVELLTRRVSSEAWRERVDAGRPVPGVKGYPKVTLRAT